MTHRSLEKVVPSFCWMLSTGDYFFDEKNTMGSQILKARALEYIDKAVECILEFRSDESDKYDQLRKTIFDVLYDGLMKDPIGVVREIYDHFGLH